MKHRSKFRPAPFGRRGYAVQEVDAFFDAAERDAVTADDARDVVFGRAALGSRGYDWEDIDRRLRELERRLRRPSEQNYR